MVTITHYLLADNKKSSGREERRDRLPSREYHRRVTVAIQLLTTGGLFVSLSPDHPNDVFQYICEYFKSALQNLQLIREDDVLLSKSGEILRLCCDLLPRQKDEHFEFTKLVDHFREMVGRQDFCTHLAGKVGCSLVTVVIILSSCTSVSTASSTARSAPAQPTRPSPRVSTRSPTSRRSFR